MSYSGPMRPVGYFGLGTDPTADLQERRFDRTWRLICVPAEPIRDLLTTLDAWANGEVPPITHSNDMKEEENPVSGLKLLWIRMGKHRQWWPGAGGEYNFGPTTFNELCRGGGQSYIGSKPANAIRIREEFLLLLQEHASQTRRRRSVSLPYPDSMWRVHADGYVRMRVDDPLLKRVRDNLVEAGYLAGSAEVSTKDNSPLVQALKRYYDEARGQRVQRGEGATPTLYSVGTWPSGTNFGPNTSGNELRIHPQLLNTVLNYVDPRAAADQERVRTVLRNMRVKPPLMGGRPSVHPSQMGLQTQQAPLSAHLANLLDFSSVRTVMKKGS